MSGDFLIGVIVPFVVVALIAAVVAFTMRARTGDGPVITLRALLLVYLYLVSAVGLIVFVAGLSNLGNAALGGLLGRDFSYYRTPYYEPRPMPLGETKPDEYTGPTEEEQRAAEKRGQDRALREDLLDGVTFAVVGGLVWGLHTLGRRKTERPDEKSGGLLGRLYLLALLVVFSIMGIVSLTRGISQTLSFYLLDSAEHFGQPPGPQLATAIVVLPFWIYYVFAAVRELRKHEAISTPA